MSTKIQILNEKQVDHFIDVLKPKLVAKFNTIRDILREQAEKEKDNFVTHAEVIELKKKQTEKLEIGKKTIILTKQLHELNVDYRICTNYYDSIIENEEELKRLEERQSKELNDLLLKLSKENLFVDETWSRRSTMLDELRARLSMTAVNDFNSIEKIILESIDINSFFKTKTLNDN